MRPFLAIVGSLIAAFIVLVIADLLLRGLSIHGVKTWLVATLLIWGVGILTSLALGAYIAKSVLPDGPGPREEVAVASVSRGCVEDGLSRWRSANRARSGR